MSTKTTFKRVALVAVAALGFGVLTSVAPASATPGNAITPTKVAVGTIPTLTPGVTSNIPVTITAPIATDNDTFTISVKVTSAPVGSGFASIASNSKAPGVSTASASFITGVVASGSTVTGTLTLSETANTTGAIQLDDIASKTDLTPVVSANASTSGTDLTTFPYTSAAIYVTFQPDVAGSYTFLVSTSAGTDNTDTATYLAGDAAVTFTAATAAAPATVTMAAVGSSAAAAGSNGQLVTVTLKDSAAGVAQLASGQTLNVSPNKTTTTITSKNAVTGATITAAATGTSGINLTNADFSGGVDS
jgi:hypothetical protein